MVEGSLAAGRDIIYIKFSAQGAGISSYKPLLVTLSLLPLTSTASSEQIAALPILSHSLLFDIL